MNVYVVGLLEKILGFVADEKSLKEVKLKVISHLLQSEAKRSIKMINKKPSRCHFSSTKILFEILSYDCCFFKVNTHRNSPLR